MPNRVSRKGKWKFSLPFSCVGKRRMGPSRSQESVSSKLAVASSVVATIAALISVWVAYKQFQLQAVQTTMQTEQAALAKEQVRIQALQALPVLTIKRKTVNASEGTSKLEVCGTTSELRMVSGFKALWLSEFGRYPLPGADTSKIQRISVAVLNGDGVKWQSTLSPSGDHCASANEPNWLPILKFVNTNLGAPAGFAYWHRSEAMVVVFQRDGTGTEYSRHYILVHERPDEAQLVPDAEAVQWISNYESAYRRHLQATISGPATNLSYVHGFFHK